MLNPCELKAHYHGFWQSICFSVYLEHTVIIKKNHITKFQFSFLIYLHISEATHLANYSQWGNTRLAHEQGTTVLRSTSRATIWTGVTCLYQILMTAFVIVLSLGGPSIVCFTEWFSISNFYLRPKWPNSCIRDADFQWLHQCHLLLDMIDAGCLLGPGAHLLHCCSTVQSQMLQLLSLTSISHTLFSICSF